MVMAERSRIVAYFDAAEKVEIEEAAKQQRVSVSAYVASAVLRQAQKDLESAAKPSGLSRFQGLLAMRGIGKEAFASLGGGEEFLRRERAEFNDAWGKRERASQPPRRKR